jgi:hypothetical protein
LSQEFKPVRLAEESSMAGRKPSREARSDDPVFTDTDWMPPPVRPDRGGHDGGDERSLRQPGHASGTVPGSETVTYAGSGLVFVNTYGSGVSAAFRS